MTTSTTPEFWVPIKDCLGIRTRIKVPVSMTAEQWQSFSASVAPHIAAQVFKLYGDRIGDVRTLKARYQDERLRPR